MAKQSIPNSPNVPSVSIINAEIMRSRIHVIRGQQVMLDYDLAEIYGYTTKAFNQQVSRNIEKFDGADFMFQITEGEADMLSVSRSQNVTTINKPLMQVYELDDLDDEMKEVNLKLNDVVTKSDISPIMLDFSKVTERREILFLNGQPAKANEAYIDIYSQARESIYIIDNYISVKTLRHLCKIKPGVKVTIFTDNLGNYLHKDDYKDFRQEFPSIDIKFIRTDNIIHDRFIILDNGKDTETIYHCGASEKDAGKKMATIVKFEDIAVKSAMRGVIDSIMGNSRLILE